MTGTPPRYRFRAPRWVFLLIAYLAIGLGFLGIFLPGLPTTPFLLVAVWAAKRGSQTLHDWLYAHRYFGPPLRAWEQERAVSTRGKIIAVALLLASWVFMAWKTEGMMVPVVTGVFFTGVAAFLLTRPAPSR